MSLKRIEYHLNDDFALYTKNCFLSMFKRENYYHDDIVNDTICLQRPLNDNRKTREIL